MWTTLTRTIIVKNFTKHKVFENSISISYHVFNGNLNNVRQLCLKTQHQSSLLCRKRFSCSQLPMSSGLSDKIASLQIKKRPVRKKRTLEDDQKQIGQNKVYAFSTAEEYNLTKLIEGLRKQGLYEPKEMDSSAETVHAVAKYPVNVEPREIFFFQEGSVVLWNVSELESSNILKFLRQYEQDSYEERMVQTEVEMMNYSYGENG